MWKCSCKCGNKEILVSARDLVHYNRKGCGVCHDTKHPLYSIWRGIISRCEDLTNKDYGGRGIKIHKDWKDEFLNFVEYVGDRPTLHHSIDRIDVNGNYEPGNVRWATAFEQARNKRDLVIGLTDEQILEIYLDKNLPEKIAEKFSISLKTVRNIKCRNYSDRASTVIINYLLRNIRRP